MDRVDAQDVAVREPCPVVVLLDEDQVTGAGPGALPQGDLGPALDAAEVLQVLADSLAQFPADVVALRHQEHVAAGQVPGDVGLPGGVEDLLGVAAPDPAVLVVLGQHRCIAGAEPQRGLAAPTRR